MVPLYTVLKGSIQNRNAMVGGQRDSAGLDCSVIIGDFLLIGSQALTLT